MRFPLPDCTQMPFPLWGLAVEIILQFMLSPMQLARMGQLSWVGAVRSTTWNEETAQGRNRFQNGTNDTGERGGQLPPRSQLCNIY